MAYWSTMKRVSVLLEDCRSMLGNRVRIKVVGDIPCPLEDADMASASRKNKTEVHKAKKSHRCPHCDKCFPQPSKLKAHILTHNRKDSCHCSECDLNDCKQHQKIHTEEKTYSCWKCGKCFMSSSKLKFHQRIHAGEKPHSCSDCGRHFRTLAGLSVHERMHTGEKRHWCSYCDKSFSSQIFLQIHNQIHTGEMPYFCIDCGSGFKSLVDLRSHEREHTVKKPYRCSQCAKCFKTAAHLQVHMRRHTKEKPFHCSDCEKSFTTPWELTSHQIVHLRVKPYPCPSCGKHFARQSNLKSHQRVHTVKKDYQCPECDKCFSKSFNLTRHQRIHRDRSHQCSQCTKSFKTSGGLKTHEQTHSDEKLYPCSECGMCCFSSESLSEHIVECVLSKSQANMPVIHIEVECCTATVIDGVTAMQTKMDVIRDATAVDDKTKMHKIRDATAADDVIKLDIIGHATAADDVMKMDVIGDATAADDQSKMDKIRDATAADEQLQMVMTYIRSGWPEQVSKIPVTIREFFTVKTELSEYKGLVTKGKCIVIPQTLRADILDRIHDGHQGLSKCRERANTSVWWPGISSEIKKEVLSCQFCFDLQKTQQNKVLVKSQLPDRPWKRIALNLCEHNQQSFLIISDFYSRYIEIMHLPTSTSLQVAMKLKATFARFGIAEEVVSDNRPQFMSTEFQELSKQLDFKHIISSPHNPQSNSRAEKAMLTAKNILKQKDPLIALMCYRSSPCTKSGASPSELLMGRKIRTTLPTLEDNLQPKWHKKKHIKQEPFYHSKRHVERQLPSVQLVDRKLTTLDQQKNWTATAVVTGESITPRSSVIETQQEGPLPSNLCHLQVVPAPMVPAPSFFLEQGENAALQNNVQQESDLPNAGMGTQADFVQELVYTKFGRASIPVFRMNL